MTSLAPRMGEPKLAYADAGGSPSGTTCWRSSLRCTSKRIVREDAKLQALEPAIVAGLKAVP